jgi:oligosaccharide repeat unit polymerase
MAEWIVHPLFLYLAVWGSVTCLYLAGVGTGLFPSGAWPTVGIVLLNVLTFSLGYLTWTMLCCSRTEEEGLSVSAGVPLTAGRLRLALRIALLSGVAAAGLCTVRLVALADTNGVSLPMLLSDPSLCRQVLTTYIDQSVYETQLTTMAISLASSVFSVGFVLLGILLYFGRGRKRYLWALAFLAVSLGIGFLNLGRKEVTVNILFVVLSYLFVHRVYRLRRTREVFHDLVLPPAALVVLFILIDVLLRKSETYQRESHVAGFLFSLYWYIASPLAAFAEFLKGQSHEYLMGQSLFFPIYKWLCRLHLAPEGTMSVMTEKLYIPYVANVYTYLRNMYEDFGLLGVAVVPYVLGTVTATLRRRAERSLPYMNLYLVLLMLVIFSFYNYLLISNQYYLQVLFAFLFFRFRLTDLDRLSE